MPRSKGKVSKAVVVVAAGKVVKGRKRARKARVMSSPLSSGSECTLEYFKSLCDPFEIGSMKLGWGCMVPTTTVSAYYRGFGSTGADGSITIAVLPCVTGGILVWNTSSSTVGTTGNGNFANATQISTNCGEGRVVSVGIRAFPNIALTVNPGVTYSGATVATDFLQLNALSTADFTQFPTSHQSVGVSGSSSTGRPIDPESFVFTNAIVDSVGWTPAANQGRSVPFSVPYVSFIGLPATTQVFYEAVLNIEATQVIAHNGQTILGDSDGITQETVGDHWPTPESLHRNLGKYLPHPGRPGEAAASKDASYLSAVWNGLTGVGKAIGHQALKTLVPGAMRTAAMALRGDGGISGQRLPSGSFGGYLQ
jgi:hypothetical protein